MGALTTTATSGSRLPRGRTGPGSPPPDPRSPDAAAEWRRICLDRQLPRARFPAGVAVPVLVCFWCLILVAGLSLAVLGGTGGRAVPGAIVDSQKQLVGRLAAAQRAAVAAGISGLQATTETFAEGAERNPDPLLAAVVATGSRWRGAAVLDANRQPVAFRGEQLTPDAIKRAVPGAAVPTVAGTGATLVVAAALPGGRLIAALTGVELRALRLNTDARQSVFISGPDGATYAPQGVAIPAENQVLTRLVQRTVTAADRRPAGLTGSLVTLTDPQTGRTRRLAPVAASAPIGNTGLSVVSVTHAARVATGPPGRGLEPSVGLGIVAVMLIALLYLVLVRPVSRVLDQAKEVACGDVPRRFVRPVLSEGARISAALARIVGRPPPRRPRGIAAGVVVTVCALAVAGWCGAVTNRYAGAADNVPAQVSVDARNEVEGVAVALRDGLTGGVTRLRTAATQAATAAAEAATKAAAAASPPTDPAAAKAAPATGAQPVAAGAAPGPDAFRAPLATVVADGDMRSAYLVDRSGRRLVTAGEKPNRRTAAPPAGSGIRLDRVTGPVPVVYAHLQVSDSHTVIAEFGVRYLAGLLRRAEGRVRVVDPDLRTILDTGGHVPFRVPAAEPVQKAATDALTNRAGTGVGTVQGSRMLLAGTTIGGDEALPALRWAVVAERPLVTLRLPANELSRGTWLVTFLALVVAVLLVAWYRLVVIRPLRQMVLAAERLAEGDVSTTICPVRHDEVGAIAVCLDIIRQTMAEGPQRLAGAVRLKGIGAEITMVMPIVRPDRADGPGTRRASRGRSKG